MTIQRGFQIFSLITVLLATRVAAATVEEIQVHSSAAGKGPRTVILVHGWTCDERTWKAQVPALTGKDYRVITLDLPGHGQSGSPADGHLSMDLFARAIESVRQEEKADRVVLVGHSMGAPAIMQYARMFPEHTAGLVLVDGSVTLPNDPMIRKRMLDFARQYGDSLKFREAAVQTMFSQTTSPDVKKQVVAMVLDAPAATPLRAMEAFVDSSNWKDDVFPEPVLAVFSGIGGTAEDRESDVQYMKSRFPELDYEKMAGTGHFLMLEKPAEFNKLLLSFLEKVKY